MTLTYFQAVEERDDQITSLREKLNTATEEMEQANALIDDLRAQFAKGSFWWIFLLPKMGLVCLILRFF